MDLTQWMKILRDRGPEEAGEEEAGQRGGRLEAGVGAGVP